MKIAALEKTVETFGLNIQNQFKLEFDAKMAQVLADGLYSNKILAIIRELSCNAYDAHAAVGNKNPFEIHLPTKLEPWFEIKDFGTGLSSEDISDIYTTYGKSTKTNSNKYIGQMGLGSKSPFAYTDAFTVSSRFNDVETIYSMYKDSNGMPNFAKMGEVKTKEHNGLTIKIPVKKVDISSFDQNYKNFFSFIEKQQQPIVNVDGLKVRKPLFSGKNWNFYHATGLGRSGLYAKMGHVVYPIDEKLFFDHCLVIDFKIGDLDVAASREALQFNKRTQKKVDETYATVNDEMSKAISAEINKQPTNYKAYAWMNKNLASFDFNKFKSSFLYKGIDLDKCISIPIDKIYDKNQDLSIMIDLGKGRVKDGLIHIKYHHAYAYFFIDDTSPEMIKQLKKYTNAYHWFFAKPNNLSWDELADLLGGIPYQFVSKKFKINKTSKKSEKSNKPKYFKYAVHGSENIIKLNELHKDRIFAHKNQSNISYITICGVNTYISKHLELFHLAGIIKKGQHILLVDKENFEKLKADPDWACLDDLVDNYIDKNHDNLIYASSDEPRKIIKIGKIDGATNWNDLYKFVKNNYSDKNRLLQYSQNKKNKMSEYFNQLTERYPVVNDITHLQYKTLNNVREYIKIVDFLKG